MFDFGLPKILSNTQHLEADILSPHIHNIALACFLNMGFVFFCHEMYHY
jgi:hypothetical protein